MNDPDFILQDSYTPIHGHLALIVCLLGTVFNMVNIVVLTHKDMRSNPINLILTGIAVADCLLMVEYIPFTLHMYLRDDQTREADEKVVVTTLGSITKIKYYVSTFGGEGGSESKY